MNKRKPFRMESAEIIAVGTEILMGQIVNTNASFLAKELQLLGINTYYQSVVGDNSERLLQAIQTAMSRSQLILLTGGLGPTPDDLTTEVVARAVNQELRLDHNSEKQIRSYFTSRNRKMAESNLKQAFFPENAIVIPNENGTAPGAVVPHTVEGEIKNLLILLPGPPNENKPMFHKYIKPILQHYSESKISNTFIHLIDLGESDAAEIVSDLLSDEQINPSLAPYAATGEVAFRLTQKQDLANQEDGTTALLAEIKKRLGPYIYEIGDRSLTEVTADLLVTNNQTVSFVESLTGGAICSELTSVKGISQVLKGGLCTYQRNSKEELLGISGDLLDAFGTVSEECAREMANKGKEFFQTDYCVSSTGVAGPEPSEGKEPGLFFIGVATPNETVTARFHYKGNRQKIRDLAVLQAINQLRKALIHQNNAE